MSDVPIQPTVVVRKRAPRAAKPAAESDAPVVAKRATRSKTVDGRVTAPPADAPAPVVRRKKAVAAPAFDVSELQETDAALAQMTLPVYDALPEPLPPVSRAKSPPPATVTVVRKARVAVAQPQRALSPPRRTPPRFTNYNHWVAELPSPPPGAAADPRGSGEWVNAFRNYIGVFLSPIYGAHADVLEEALSQGNLRIFARAFSDISFSADDNETIETLGDKGLALAFCKHVYSKMPGVKSSTLTNFLNNYMAKTYQAKLATEMKFHEWVLLGPASAAARESATTTSMREDIFESLASSLDQVATAMHQSALAARDYEKAAVRAIPGPEALRMLIDFIFDTKGLSVEMGLNAAKTELGSVGTIFGMRNQAIIFDSTDSGAAVQRHSVYIHRALHDVLVENGIDAAIPLTLVKDAPSASEAAEHALAVCAQFGLTREWISEKREISRGVATLGGGLADAVMRKARANGMVKVIFEIPERSRQPDGNFTTVLIGADAQDRRHTLASAIGQVFGVVKAAAARAYVA